MTKRFLRAVAGLLVFTVLSFGVAGYLWWKWATGPKATGKATPIRVKVVPGESLLSVANALEQQGVIRSARALTLLGKSEPIKPGVYDLLPSETPRRVLRHLVQGDIATNRVTFPEGFTVQQIAHRLLRLGLVTNEAAFLDLVTQHGDTLKALFPLPANLEGYLFPDTYNFPVGASEKEIAQRMVDTFAKQAAEKAPESQRPLSEIVTVASLIEREAETPEDRPRIAGVIYNRLKKGMKLQIDATVQYARGQHKNRLLFRDLEIDSPYNTYKVAGLPPGPICNPGLASLDAARNPEPSDYLFYVAGPDGKAHIFTRTFAEHQAAIARVRHQAR